MATLRMLALIAVFGCWGCGAVIAYDRMQEENDKQVLVRDYRQCVEAHMDNPSACDHITSGFRSVAVTLHQSGN